MYIITVLSLNFNKKLYDHEQITNETQNKHKTKLKAFILYREL